MRLEWLQLNSWIPTPSQHLRNSFNHLQINLCSCCFDYPRCSQWEPLMWRRETKNIKTAEIKPLLYDITDHLFGMPEKMPDISISFGKTNTHTQIDNVVCVTDWMNMYVCMGEWSKRKCSYWPGMNVTTLQTKMDAVFVLLVFNLCRVFTNTAKTCM